MAEGWFCLGKLEDSWMGLAVSCGRRLDALVLELQHCGCGTAEEHRALLYCTHHAMRERESLLAGVAFPWSWLVPCHSVAQFCALFTNRWKRVSCLHGCIPLRPTARCPWQMPVYNYKFIIGINYCSIMTSSLLLVTLSRALDGIKRRDGRSAARIPRLAAREQQNQGPVIKVRRCCTTSLAHVWHKSNQLLWDIAKRRAVPFKRSKDTWGVVCLVRVQKFVKIMS